MTGDVVLLDASAFWRLGSPGLDPARRAEINDRVTRGLPWLWNQRAGGASSKRTPAPTPVRRSALAIPPLGYLIAAIAGDHGAAVRHYGADFECMAAHIDLAVTPEALAPLGTSA